MYRCWWQVDGAEGVYGIFLLLQFLDGVRSKDINKKKMSTREKIWGFEKA